MVIEIVRVAFLCGTRRAAGLPFSGPLAGNGIGSPLGQVFPLVVVRHLSHHANGFCARQPRHSPSTVLDTGSGGAGQIEAQSYRANFLTTGIQTIGFGYSRLP